MFSYNILIVLLSVLYLFYYYITRTFNYWKIRNVAGPKPVPLFGNIMDPILRRKTIGEVFKNIYDEFTNEKVVGVYRMTTPALLLRDLDVIKDVLIRDFDYFSDRGVSFSEKGLGTNLFHAESDLWRFLRARFTLLFTSGKIKNMVHTVVQCGDKLVNYVQCLTATKQEQEIHLLMKKYTMATVSACVIGLEFDTLNDQIDLYAKIDNMVFSPTFKDEVDMMYPGLLKKLKLEPFPDELLKLFESFVEIAAEKRNGIPSSRKDLIDVILELRQQREIQIMSKLNNVEQRNFTLTDSIFAAQVLVFYAAGYETSATTMSFMLYELAKNPDIQDKVIAEVDEVLKKYNGQISYEALMDLNYMEKVFDETLRLYPLMEPLQRCAQQDYKVPGTDVIVKKGQVMLISANGIHRDEKYYPNPDKFDPERFSADNSKARHSCAYIPFGTGPRNCIDPTTAKVLLAYGSICEPQYAGSNPLLYYYHEQIQTQALQLCWSGMRFAKVQSRVCMMKFFSKFRVEPSKMTLPRMKFAARRFIVAPDGGIHLKIIPRNK